MKKCLLPRRATEDMQVRGSGCDPTQLFAVFRCGFSTPDLSAAFPPGSGIYSQLQKVYAVDRSSDTYFAPRVMLEWSITDNVLTYTSISKGVKPGGIGTVASGTWMDQQPDGDLDELKFDAETLIAYELGVKSTLFDNTVTLNGAIFFQDYSDKQVPVQTITNGFPFSSIENAGKANVRGLEIEAVWQVVDHVRLQAGYSYLDGKYTDLVYQTNSANSIARAGNCQLIDSDNVGGPDQCAISLSGNSLEDVPEHSLIAMVGYYPPFNSRLNGLLETDMEYQSSRYNDEFNDREVDSYVLFNLRAGVQSDRWDALLYVNNVLDDDTIRNWSSGNGLVATAERTDSNMVAFPSDGFSLAPAPRHWGLRLNMRF